MKIEIAIVEDEEQAYQQIRRYLEQYAAERSIELHISHFADGVQITDAYCPKYDIILMDIAMPRMDGLTAARFIRSKDPAVIIIFVTNLPQHAIQGYGVHAFDYLLKPLAYASLCHTLDEAVALVERCAAQYIAISTKERVQKLAVWDIKYIEIRSHTLFYHTVSGVYRATGKMQDAEKQMMPYHFYRCNNGYLVNLAYVDAIQDNNVILGGALLPISRSRKKPFSEALVAYVRGRLH